MKNRSVLIIFIILLSVVLFLLLIQFPPGGDFSQVLQPSTRALLEGRNPYDEMRFLSPPWAFLALIPPALLPPVLGSALFALIGAAGFGLAFHRLKVTPAALAFLVANPAFLAALFNPNLDWTVALGFTLPPQIGLFFVLTKPQISAPLALFWLVEAWREGRIRRVLIVFAPVAAAYLLSVLFFGPWMLHVRRAVFSPANTANVWPWGLIAGFALLAVGLRRREARLSLMGGPFFSPYLATYSWLPAILGLAPDALATSAACVGLWIAWLTTNHIIL